ncbi:DUF6573 family protein [Paenibacillus sp. NPDC056579]|uniref:DUF6573 family protein n=1 Tax=Paenibacillus sp. NPDC056579 TaxID=3345871 RepID=UPI00368B73F7
MIELFGDLEIHQYTRDDMIQDGRLIDVTSTAKEIGFHLPVTITRAVWTDNIEPSDGKGLHENNESSTLWHCLEMLYIGLRHTKTSEPQFMFPVIVKDEKGEEQIIILKAILCKDTEGEPVITIMEREEE